MVATEELDFFKKNGYLIVRDFLSDQETEDLKRWAQEVHDWKATEESAFMPYEVRHQRKAVQFYLANSV